MATKTKKYQSSKRKRSFVKPQLKDYKKFLRRDFFGKGYMACCIVILLITTLFWAILGAKVQQNNADQLVNPYLFENKDIFHNAFFPGQHTFLIKWPIFLLVKLFGLSANTFMIFTVGIVIATVVLFVLLLHRIEHRPIYFGTICLALASVLLLIPAVIYPGGLLPVNMAMITTRNIEYIVFIFSLVMIARSAAIKSWGFWIYVVGMSLLIASDKLFLVSSVGGALISLVIYGLFRRQTLTQMSLIWLTASILSAIGATIILWLTNISHITAISTMSSLGPYGTIVDTKTISLGLIFAVLELLTNFGANPAPSVSILKEIPHQVYNSLTSFGGITFIINVAILFACIFAVYQLINTSLVTYTSRTNRLKIPHRLSIMLVWSTAATFTAFILSHHYYAGDSRYLTVALFTGFIAIATFMNNNKWQPEKLVLAGTVIAIGILLGSIVTWRTYNQDQSALSVITKRNLTIDAALTNHPVNVLVGNYWRVLPIKLTNNKQKVMPLMGCFQPQTVLSSKDWQFDLNKTRFAYLLTLDQNTLGHQVCSINDVIRNYGRPNSSILIAGSLDKPKELLLFYDKGARQSAPTIITPIPSTVLPISLSILPNTSCPTKTVMNVVAHQDDDLLFMNPDTLTDIKSGNCVRTIYITAGDAGNNKLYWLKREQGSEAAYSYMLHFDSIWINRIVKLSNNEFITVANPRGNTKVSLIFFHLPDGNLRGQGFSNNNYESLARLAAGKVSVLNSVDKQSYYTSTQLTAALTSLMNTYHPAEIRTQADYVSHVFPDHSDHITVGHYTENAYQQYTGKDTAIVNFYIGYPIRTFPANETGPDYINKLITFLAYAKSDSSVCQSQQQCEQSSTYGAYLKRQYTTNTD